MSPRRHGRSGKKSVTASGHYVTPRVSRAWSEGNPIALTISVQCMQVPAASNFTASGLSRISLILMHYGKLNGNAHSPKVSIQKTVPVSASCLKV